MPEVQVYPTAEAASSHLAKLLEDRLRAGGRAVLAGGHTPLAAYRILSQADLLWERLQLLPSDERCLPPDHPERNDRALREALGHHPYTLYSFPAERGPEAAADATQALVAELLPFDVVLLGLGEDGHTASLFPQLPGIDSEALVVPVHQAPKPPPERVSLGRRALEATELVIFMVTGSEKQTALRKLLAGEDIPAARIQAPQVLILTDRAALPKE
jgi:6-phosphogluconolactonase